MSETTHTPGPWISRPQHSKDRRVLGWIIERDHDRIGWASFAKAGQRTEDAEKSPYPTDEANAALIAAAPDLYEALKTMVETYTVPSSTGAAIDRARAALAKCSPQTQGDVSK